MGRKDFTLSIQYIFDNPAYLYCFVLYIGIFNIKKTSPSYKNGFYIIGLFINNKYPTVNRELYIPW